MEFQHPDNIPPGATRLQLGPVERWVVGLCAAAVTGGGFWFATQTWSRLDKVVEQQAEVSKQQAVANAQLTAVANQLAEIPKLRADTARLQTDVATLQAQMAGVQLNRGLPR